MATYKQGVLGAFKGKLGNVVGSFWKGKAVIRALPNEINDANTPAQQEVRARFRLLMNMIASLKILINIGMGAYDRHMTTLNAAFKFNYDAITGVFPDLKINLSMFILSKGTRSQLLKPVLESIDPGIIDLTWDMGNDQSLYSDSIMAAVFDPESGTIICYHDVAKRFDEFAELELPEGYSGKSLTVMAFTASPNALIKVRTPADVSNSQNLGAVTLK